MAHAMGMAGSVERGFPVWGGPAERLRFLLQWAVLAPSRHNSQPWIFEIEGGEVRIFADLSRALPAADPDGRQLVMSCGGALANLRLAAAHFGHATTSEVVTGVRRDGLLARVRLEDRCASTPEAEEMFQAIPRRRTNRLPLDGREPPQGLLTALLREARHEGAWLRPVEERERIPVAELVAEGEQRASSSRFRTELSRWVRPNGTLRRDGMPGYALGMSDAAALLQPLLLRLGGARDESERDRRRATTCKALLLLSTPRDGNADWLAAGEALQRILLRAAAKGLFASYFMQPIEVPELRRRLRELLVDPGAPQVLFRLGYGLEVRPVPRRPVSEVLRSCAQSRSREEALAVRTPPPVARAAPGGAAHSPLQ
jgi:nitroreductase